MFSRLPDLFNLRIELPVYRQVDLFIDCKGNRIESETDLKFIGVFV